MIAIDTDVLAVHHIFHNSPRYASTREFFVRIEDQLKAVTVFNLLELAGIFASANRAKESRDVFERYLRTADISILFPNLAAGNATHFWQAVTSESFARIQRGMRLGDAVILWTLETNENIDAFITWNPKHFKEKTSIKVLTPPEFS
jgi:hypothetical protein